MGPGGYRRSGIANCSPMRISAFPACSAARAGAPPIAPLMSAPRLRLRKIILPGLQLKLMMPFLMLGVSAILFQGIVLLRALSQAAEHVGEADQEILAQASGIVTESLLIGCLFLVPLCVVVGVVVTFRVAGPVYRFKMYLGEIARGEYNGPCRLRKGDELQFIAERINAAVDRLRADQAASEDAEPELRRAA